jgi:hypothetical protein
MYAQLSNSGQMRDKPFDSLRGLSVIGKAQFHAGYTKCFAWISTFIDSSIALSGLFIMWFQPKGQLFSAILEGFNKREELIVK